MDYYRDKKVVGVFVRFRCLHFNYHVHKRKTNLKFSSQMLSLLAEKKEIVDISILEILLVYMTLEISKLR
jgi:7-cyano-7-deazaguanine synthase in queuosine biosynthesis